MTQLIIGILVFLLLTVVIFLSYIGFWVVLKYLNLAKTGNLIWVSFAIMCVTYTTSIFILYIKTRGSL